MENLSIATCQFPVSGDPTANAGHILRLMGLARRRGAHLAHFPECALSGYAGIHLPTYRDFQWAVIEAQTRRILAGAEELGLWVVFGSSHRLSGDHKPHNSLYVVDDRGRLVTRYDKVFCCGRGGETPTEDLAHYSPGAQLVDFACRGRPIGLLICHDFRYPELYREYKRRGVEIILQSFHNAGMSPAHLAYYHTQVTFTLQAAAASNFVWISASNASEPAAWASFVANPAGVVTRRLPRRRAAFMVHEIGATGGLWDPAAFWREQCLAGVLHSGELVSDPRSADRHGL